MAGKISNPRSMARRPLRVRCTEPGPMGTWIKLIKKNKLLSKASLGSLSDETLFRDKKRKNPEKIHPPIRKDPGKIPSERCIYFKCAWEILVKD